MPPVDVISTKDYALQEIRSDRPKEMKKAEKRISANHKVRPGSRQVDKLHREQE